MTLASDGMSAMNEVLKRTGLKLCYARPVSEPYNRILRHLLSFPVTALKAS